MVSATHGNNMTCNGNIFIINFKLCVMVLLVNPSIAQWPWQKKKMTTKTNSSKEQSQSGSLPEEVSMHPNLTFFLLYRIAEYLMSKNQMFTAKWNEGVMFCTHVLWSYLNIFKPIDIFALTSFGYN